MPVKWEVSEMVKLQSLGMFRMWGLGFRVLDYSGLKVKSCV